MVKLASPSVPEGVWLRLPDCSRINGGRPDEVAVVLDTLKVRSLESCVLLNAICSLPEAGNIMAQYSDPVELVNDGDDLGYVLDEQGQGMPNFMEKFFAALEYEGCRSLRFALDISQNLHCYEWVSRNNLKDFGKARLRESGVSPELIDSGYIDLDAYAADLLESEGYTLTNDKSAYIARNDKEFIYERSTPEEAGMTMHYAGKWVILFSHPADFTPVCTTEFMTFGSMIDEFKALNTELVGLSVDSIYSHIAWLRKIQELEWNGKKHINVTFPLIEDIRMEVANKYGMIQPGQSNTQAVRAVFVIDPNGVVRTILYYPLSTGRNFEEIKRIILALQKADADACATPADWRPGDDVIVPTAGSCGVAKERMDNQSENQYCLDWFMCFRKESK